MRRHRDLANREARRRPARILGNVADLLIGAAVGYHHFVGPSRLRVRAPSSLASDSALPIVGTIALMRWDISRKAAAPKRPRMSRLNQPRADLDGVVGLHDGGHLDVNLDFLAVLVLADDLDPAGGARARKRRPLR